MRIGASRRAPADRARVVADALHSAAIHLLRWVRDEDRRQALTPARLSALSVLVFGGPHTLGRLAEAEQVSPATICGVVDRLERDGLARRSRIGADRREVLVAATPRGRALLLAARRRRIARLATRMSALALRDLDALEVAARLMEALARPPSPAPATSRGSTSRGRRLMPRT